MQPTEEERQTSYYDLLQTAKSACRSGNTSTVQELVPQLRSLKATEEVEEDFKGLLSAAFIYNQPNVVSHLLSEGIPLQDTTPIRAVGANTSLECIQLALNAGWDINTGDDARGTALIQALLQNDVNLVRFLVSKGADVNMETMPTMQRLRRPVGVARGTTPLDIAASASSLEILQILLDNGAKLERSSALHKAASSPNDKDDRLPVMQFLLDCGMDINAFERFPDDTRFDIRKQLLGTPLHYATARGNVKAVRFLLEHGADKSVVAARDTGTPYRWAHEYPPGENEEGEPDINEEIVQMLK